MNSDTVRARFAPSPTGYLHVGGARTALFNWLFCRKHGGQFILRIEDTDILRNIEGAERKLLDDLTWLGIEPDEGPDQGGPFGPYRQSERRDLYEAAVNKLLDEGKAYYAWDTPEELDVLRKAAQAEKRTFRYPRPTTLPTKAEADRARAEGRSVVVRFRVPDEPITVHDEILGDVTFGAGEMEDLVIYKSNGWPTYHFAVVVDDYHMQITHVLRAQEHLMNTPKHVFMQRALGYAPPKFAHLPLVFNIGGAKMSKREKYFAIKREVSQLISRLKAGDTAAQTILDRASEAARGKDILGGDIQGYTSEMIAAVNEVLMLKLPEIDVHDFKLSGYLPEALTNFVALIGWSPGDDREIMTRQEMIEFFSLDRINKTAGRFDREKLLAVNTTYCAEAKPERLLAAFRDWAESVQSPMRALDDAKLLRVIELCKGMRTLADIETKAGVLFVADDSIVYEPDAVKKVLQKKEGQGYALLERAAPALESIASWTVAAIDAAIKELAESAGVSMGDVAQPLRVAIAGRAVSPAIAESLELIGKAGTLNRIRRCLAQRA